MDKLPANVLSVLVENGCSIEKCSSDNASDIKLRAEVEAGTQESHKATACRLIAEAQRDLETNAEKYGYSERFVRENLENAATYVVKGDYKYAYNELVYSKSLSKNFDKYPELMGAIAALS